MHQPITHQPYLQSLEYLKKKQRVLFLTTSNRWSGEEGGQMPKSTQLAYQLSHQLEGKAQVIEVPTMNIFSCEGNVSTERGNTCGEQKASLKDDQKNPTGHHRCWASINHPDDELWKISKELLQSDCVVFFSSVRWGQTNAIYQKLIERLTWLENRHSTLGENNILEGIDAGLILIGQNWHGKEVLETQKKVLEFFGFHIVDDLFWNWQFLENAEEEDQESYRKAPKAFKETFLRVLE
ncbi:MAG: hypothetical protein AB7J40_05735 [Candidatus Altimarinota bacterium]